MDLQTVTGRSSGSDGEVAGQNSSPRYSGSSDDDSCSPSTFLSMHSISEWVFDWRELVWTRRPTRALLCINAVVIVGVFLGKLLIYEASTAPVRERRHSTAIFPLYVNNAAGFAFACKWHGSAALPNLVGFFAGTMYVTARNNYDLLNVRLLYLFLVSFIPTVEVQIGADFLRRRLCRNRGKVVPTIDTVHEALSYSVVVLGVTLCFETLLVVAECAAGMADWPSFPKLWSTRSMGVLAALLTIAPALIHSLAYRPRYSHILKPGKIAECLFLVIVTAVILSLVIFSIKLTAVIRPLPYLIYPLLIFSVFRFNRLGWTLVVAGIAFFLSWGSLHYKSSALYYTSGSSGLSSPKFLLQIQLQLSVLGMVAIALAGAVRERKQLTKDLHYLNQRLEEAVSKRTQELIKANMELQVSQAHAEKANLAKSDFLANMSHEIRTPIHGILGLTALLFQSDLSADQLENLSSVKDCADLLLHIINSILDLAKIEAGRLEVESVPFSIRKVVSGTLRMLQVRAKERGLQLLWRVDAHVPSLIAGDPGKLQQCLLNLVGNALKFTHKGSVRVHISLHTGFESSFSHVLSIKKYPSRPSPPNKVPPLPSRLRSWSSWPSSDVKMAIDEDDATSSVIEMFDTHMTESYLSSKGSSNRADIVARTLGLQKPETKELERVEYVLIEVRDTGIGISKENVLEMFNPFTQADASTSRLYGGTGLGLSIVQRFVELLGGKIWVESEVGKGSIFSFVVPFRRVESTQTLSGRKPESSQSSVAAFQPLLASFHKPPRLQKQNTLQQLTTLGNSRRAHSLNTLMKNLKFSSTQFGEAEPLLQMPVANCSGDQGRKQLSTEEISSEVHGTAGSNVTQKVHETMWGAGIVEPKLGIDNSIGMSYRGSPSMKLTNLAEKDLVNAGRPADPNEDQLPGASGVGSVNIGKYHLVQPGYVFESSSTSGVMRRARDGYPDLELGIVNINGNHGSRNTSREGMKDSAVDVHLSAALADSTMENETSKAADSTPSQGLQYRALFPRKEHLRVLLAEDNIINQKVATRQLQRHGHTVTIVGDGLQALNAIRSNHDKFDLVLMDIQMPKMDGLEATGRIRQEEIQQGWRRIPILGLTAHAISGYQDTCLSHGMDAYLGKPFEISQLLQIMQKVI